MAVDMNRLSPGEQLIGVSAVALFVVSFLHWLGGKITSLTVNGRSIPSTRYHFTHGAWGYTATLIAVLLGLSMLAYVAARLAGVELPRGRLVGRLLTALGALAFVLVLLQLLAGAPVNLDSFGLPSVVNLGGVHLSVAKTRSVGIYAGLVASAGLGVGGFLTVRDR